MISFRYFALLSLQLVLLFSSYNVECSLEKLGIHGGVAVPPPPHDHKGVLASAAVAALFRDRNLDRVHCGAALWNSRAVLTAWHCVDDGSHYQVYIGHPDTSGQIDPSFLYNVAEIIPFNATAVFPNSYTIPRYDLAVLRLDRPLRRGPAGALSCLDQNPEPEFSLQDNNSQLCIAYGWGTGHEGDRAQLHQVALPLGTDDQCASDCAFFDPDLLVCAGFPGDKTRKSCNGDSGSPLLCPVRAVESSREDFREVSQTKYALVGLTSFTYGTCGGNEFHGFYTRVSHYRGWIERLVGPMDGCIY